MNFSSKKLTKMIIFNFALFLLMSKLVNSMWRQGGGSPEIQEVDEEVPSGSGVYGKEVSPGSSSYGKEPSSSYDNEEESLGSEVYGNEEPPLVIKYKFNLFNS
jgi:hypothetical protein